jgi:hypothetical protein
MLDSIIDSETGDDWRTEAKRDKQEFPFTHGKERFHTAELSEEDHRKRVKRGVYRII